MEPSGAVAAGGRIKPGDNYLCVGLQSHLMIAGDLLLAVNGDTLWRVTSSRAREVLAEADTAQELVQ